MSNRYYADPNRIQAGVRQLEDIAEIARGMTADFLDEISDTVTWPGTSDEFAKKVRPQEIKERQTTKDTCMAIRDAVIGITEGTLENVQTMKALRNQALENIAHQSSRVSDVTDGRGRH
ncbi:MULTISPECIES: hypothetical protein [unclassified Streptomyces]|uniref:hypothetical protein n=1 Tax=unclassified Streptomyces TaxID=2593676 RepID=UPI00332E5CC2